MTLKGKQKKLDKNNNGRIDAGDFALMKKAGYKMGGGMIYANDGTSVNKYREIAKGRLNERAKQINQKKVDSFPENLGGKSGPKLTARDKDALRFIKKVEARDATGKKSFIDDMAKGIKKREESVYNVERGMGTGYKMGGVMKAKSGDLADTMKKLRKRAYEKSMKKSKKVGKFGDDEYLIQKPLPGMKKGKMIKAKTGKYVFDMIAVKPMSGLNKNKKKDGFLDDVFEKTVKKYGLKDPTKKK